MRSPRYAHLLAATALASLIALPESALAQARGRIIVRSHVLRPPAAIKVKQVPLPVQRPPLDDVAAAEPGGLAALNTPAEQPQVAPIAPKVEPQAAPVAPEQVAAPPPPPKVDPLASLDPDDRPIAEKMRDLLAAKTDKIFATRKERTAVDAFYQGRNLKPLWFDGGVINARAKAAIARVKASAADGLDPNDYKIAEVASANPDVIAEAELKFTATLITFTRHLQAGRFPYQRIGHDIEVPQQPPETADVLAKLADDVDITAALDSYSPPHEGYRKLRAMLAEMRAKSGAGTVRISDGPVLKVAKVAMEDARVPQLRVRLGFAEDPSDLRYDQKLADALKKFQQANDLSGTGQLDARTVKELNGPPRDRQIDIVLANMERWRWLPRELGAAHVLVNIPEYQLRVFKNGSMIWNTRIVTGKPTLQTPLLSAEMKYVTVNPTWNVPPSIIEKEYLPVLQQDPTALARIGLQVVYNRDGTVHIFQPPGDGNALGRLRFNFPNRFLVYQHDTPDKHLFAQEARAFSHGCMRVLDPPKYAEVLLSIANPKENWSAERVRRMYGGAEQDIHFQNNIPVHLTYQTATVEDGQLVLRKDIYGYDARMISALRSERGLIEMAQDRPKETGSGGSGGRTTTRVAQQPPPRTGGFFDSLFGGPTYYSRPPVPPQQLPQQRRPR